MRRWGPVLSGALLAAGCGAGLGAWGATTLHAAIVASAQRDINAAAQLTRECRGLKARPVDRRWGGRPRRI